MKQSSATRKIIPEIRAGSNAVAQHHPATSGAGFTDLEASTVPAQDVAAYIADMVGELRAMAQQCGFETLGRILDIAEREANWRAQGRL